jgi:putative oxidoreductase
MAKNNLIVKILNETNPSLVSLSLLLLRCTIGILLFIAGSGKLFGWFGGFGMEATIQGFSKIGISMPLTYLSTFTEFTGGLLLIIGLLTRPAAFAVMINMLVATLVTLPHGFMGPTGAQTPFIFLVIDIVILLAGPMVYSIDMFIFRKSVSSH